MTRDGCQIQSDSAHTNTPQEDLELVSERVIIMHNNDTSLVME